MGRAARIGRGLLQLTAGASLLAACSSKGDPRPQLLVVIDTDAAAVGQVLLDPTLSGDATVDTVRVDAIDSAGRPFDLRDFVAPEAVDWPISFGVAAPEVSASGSVRLRIRAFRGAFAQAGDLNGVSTLDPRPEVTIDRLVDLAVPGEGIEGVRVVLSLDCLGVPTSFLPPATTCIDAAAEAASPGAGVELLGDAEVPASVVGSAPHAREVACAVPAGDGQVCIPGGLSILGELGFSGIADGYVLLDSVPLRPVRLSPFLLDRTELTVGRFRPLVQAGTFDGELPPQHDDAAAATQFCTWLGPADDANDALPLNCVGWATAARACELLGGGLPTEAQWEHAARGRGQRRLYPWGEQDPTCCATSASRQGTPDVAVECAGQGIEPAGSHPRTAECQGLGDVSRDEVLDLAGSLVEALRDKFRPFDAACWQATGVALDPLCADDSASSHAGRGSYWNGGLATTAAPLRRVFVDGSAGEGFRCAFPGSGP
jgi:formylglycine-generating enzyme required for sulfatase activity